MKPTARATEIIVALVLYSCIAVLVAQILIRPALGLFF